jgi:hypothetical protein
MIVPDIDAFLEWRRRIRLFVNKGSPTLIVTGSGWLTMSRTAEFLDLTLSAPKGLPSLSTLLVLAGYSSKSNV